MPTKIPQHLLQAVASLPVRIRAVLGNDELEFREATNRDPVASCREHQQLLLLLQSEAVHYIPEPPAARSYQHKWPSFTFNIFLFRAIFYWVPKVTHACFGFPLLCSAIGYNKLMPPEPIRSKTKTNHYLLASVFPRLAPFTCTVQLRDKRTEIDAYNASAEICRRV